MAAAVQIQVRIAHLSVRYDRVYDNQCVLHLSREY